MDDIRPPKPREASPLQPKTVPTTPQPQLELPNLAAPGDVLNQNKSIAPKPRRWLRAVLITLAVLLVTVIASLAAAWSWYTDALMPKSASEERIAITIETGETADTIGKELEEKGIIKSGLAFQWYIQLQGSLNSLQAGDYMLSPSQSVPEIVEWLIGGKVDNFNITILPGKNLEEIKQKLVEVGFPEEEVDAALTKQYDHPLLKHKPADVNLEGYIFPDTYEITSQTSAEQLIELTFDIFYQRIQEGGLETALQQRGFNLHQGITLASLVQLEVADPTEQRQVAQILESRLEMDMRLDIDATYLYAATLLDVEPSLSIDSPYNTRLHEGLPPGAIANFNLSALEAVANPAPGDYLYYVTGDDGTTHFSKTYEEHQENIKNYCTQLCSSE